METQSLEDILAQGVEVNTIPVIENDYEAPEIEDYEPIPETVHTYQQEEIPSAEAPQAMPHSHFAENLVGLIDGLQSSLIPMWRKNALFTAKDLQILDGLDTSGGTVYQSNTPEFKILERWNKHLAFATNLPFSASEKDRLIAATQRYAATMQITVSPFTGLLMAFGEVAGTRFAMFLND